MDFANSVLDTIGNTPLIKLNNLSGIQNAGTVLLKNEALNPCGSIKDRAANFMIASAEANGILSPGGTIIEATSGNTGIALAMIGFGSVGILSGTAAASWHAAIGNVSAGSLFSFLQRLGMTGFSPITQALVLVSSETLWHFFMNYNSTCDITTSNDT